MYRLGGILNRTVGNDCVRVGNNPQTQDLKGAILHLSFRSVNGQHASFGTMWSQFESDREDQIQGLACLRSRPVR